MAKILPFAAVRPSAQLASTVAALPYDVYSREEAASFVADKPLSFLNIDRPETQFPPEQDMYAPEVYDRATAMLQDWLARGVLLRETQPCYYIYELTMDGRAQTGIVACSAIDDYLDGVCKKHENTVEKKELDRIRHVDVCSAQTGPIFLAYRARADIQALVSEAKEAPALYEFLAEDGIRHRVWRIMAKDRVAALRAAFEFVPASYIADGHHRAASAVKVGLARRKDHPDYSGSEEFNYFLSVLFPDDELKIMDYNRVVKDLNGNSVRDFLTQLEHLFVLERQTGEEPCRPAKKGELGMYLEGSWYRLNLKAAPAADDPVSGLDVSLLQTLVLGPLLGIGDPRTDSRIEFVGGIRGLGALCEKVDRQNERLRAQGKLEKLGPAVAFAMYPTSIGELLAVADAGLLMPPKSTWFEPKLRSGLFIHEFER